MAGVNCAVSKGRQGQRKDAKTMDACSACGKALCRKSKENPNADECKAYHEANCVEFLRRRAVAAEAMSSIRGEVGGPWD